MIWRLTAAGITVTFVVPCIMWLFNGAVIAIGGQLFFLFWFLPVIYCIFKSILKSTTR